MTLAHNPTVPDGGEDLPDAALLDNQRRQSGGSHGHETFQRRDSFRAERSETRKRSRGSKQEVGMQAYTGFDDHMRVKGYDYSTLESSPGGYLIMEQRKKLKDTFPRVLPKVDGLVQQAEKEFNSVGQRLKDEAADALAEAYHCAEKLKSGCTARSGVPPDHPDFPRVQEIEDKLDRYMAEAVRLHKLAQSYKADIHQWRTQVEELGAQRPALMSTFKNARRQNQLFEAVSKGPEFHAGATSSSLRSTDSRYDPMTPRRPSTVPSRQRPSLLKPELPGGLLSREGFEERRLASAPAEISARGRQSSAPSQLSPAKGDDKLERLVDSCNNMRDQDAQTFEAVSGERETVYKQEVAALEGELKRVREEIRHLRNSNAQGVGKRCCLEEFFLLCMDDLRREHSRRKSLSAGKGATSRPTTTGILGRAALGTPQQALCNSFGASTSSIGSSAQGRREEVLDILISSESLLAFLFEKMFPHRAAFYSIKRRDGNPGIGTRLNTASSSAARSPRAWQLEQAPFFAMEETLPDVPPVDPVMKQAEAAAVAAKIVARKRRFSLHRSKTATEGMDEDG
jgi:hypothetical protein